MPNQINVRPIIAIENLNSSITELFQSKTLRPILKLQNHSLLFLFKQYLIDTKIKITELTDEKKDYLIHQILKKEVKFKSLLIGMVVGHFTEEELLYYCSNTREINKRIVELLIKRISDQKNTL